LDLLRGRAFVICAQRAARASRKTTKSGGCLGYVPFIAIKTQRTIWGTKNNSLENKKREKITFDGNTHRSGILWPLKNLVSSDQTQMCCVGKPQAKISFNGILDQRAGDGHLMLVVVAPAAALLLVVSVVATSEALALAVSASAAVLAALVSLARSLVAESAESTVLATGLTSVRGVLLLLEVARVSTVALLGRLRGRQSRLAWCSVGGRSGASGLGGRRSGAVGRLRVSE
jgi:hypothetical protein